MHNVVIIIKNHY